MDDEPYPELCNQILQFYSLKGNSAEAYDYFSQITQKDTSWSLSASTLLMYSSLIRKVKDADQIYSLIQYMRSKNIESSFVLSRYETRKQLFAELDQAVEILKKYLNSPQYSRVRMEYMYYVIAQAVQERKFGVAASFFVDAMDILKSPANISDIIVFSGCVEMMISRIPFKHITSIIRPAMEVERQYFLLFIFLTVHQIYSALDEEVYLRHLSERREKASSTSSSTLVVPEVYSRIKPASLVSQPILDFRAFLNMNYLVLIDVLYSEGQYELVERLSQRLCRVDSDQYCFSLLETMVSTILSNSMNVRPYNVDGFHAPKENNWFLLSTSLLTFLNRLRASGLRCSEAIYETLVRKLCCDDAPLPFSPGLATYIGDEDLPQAVLSSKALVDVDEVLEMMEADRVSWSTLLQRAVLRAYLSYAVTNSSDTRGFEYYRSLESECENNQSSIDPLLRQMVEEANIKIKERHKNADSSDDVRISLQRRLLPNDGKPSLGFKGNTTASNLYSKVLETLLSAHRSQDAKALLQLMQSKNISAPLEEVYVLMAHELKANNSIGAIEIFSAFFRMPESAIPDIRSINLLGIALTRSKNFTHGQLAKELLPKIIENKLNLSTPVFEAFFSACMHTGDYLTASGYLMLVPPMQRKISALSALAKSFAVNGRIDLFYKYRSENPFPFEVVCHLIAGYAIKGLPKKAFNLEHIIRKAAKIRNLQIPFWVRTFLLHAAATGSSWSDASRLINEPDAIYSELDYNLACLAGLRYVLKSNRTEETAVSPSVMTDIRNLIFEMKSKNFRVTLIVLQLAESIGLDLDGFSFCETPSASVEVLDACVKESKLDFIAPFSSNEIESLGLLSFNKI